MSKFAAFVNSVIWSWTHLRGLNDIKKFAKHLSVFPMMMKMRGIRFLKHCQGHKRSKDLVLLSKKLRKLGLQNMENIKQMTQKSPED